MNDTVTTGVVYESTVTAVGSQVEAFLAHGILVLFGDQAPEELHDMSVLHRPSVSEDGPRPGDLVVLGDTELEILAVGDVVRDNLLNLGHMDIKADGNTEARLPGDVCVAEQDLPQVQPGDAFRIVRGDTDTEEAAR